MCSILLEINTTPPIFDRKRQISSEYEEYDSIFVSFTNRIEDENRTVETYQLEIKFDNISKFCCRPLEKDTVQIMLVMRRPVKVLNRSREGFKEVPSPMRFKGEDDVF